MVFFDCIITFHMYKNSITRQWVNSMHSEPLMPASCEGIFKSFAQGFTIKGFILMLRPAFIKNHERPAHEL